MEKNSEKRIYFAFFINNFSYLLNDPCICIYIYIYIYIYIVCVCWDKKKNTRSSEDDFIHSYLPMLNVSVFRPSSGYVNY